MVEATRRFTMSTAGRLERALLRALLGRRPVSDVLLQRVVGDASRELRAEGLDDQAVLDVLGTLVEVAGGACGANRPSLLSGQLRWMPVRTQVLELARVALGTPVPTVAWA